MIVYTGRRGLHIFDIDQEKWVINSKKTGHQYEDLYFKVRNVQNEPEVIDEDYDEESENTDHNYPSSGSQIDGGDMIEISDDEEMEDELVQDGYHSFDEEDELGQIEEEKGQE